MLIFIEIYYFIKNSKHIYFFVSTYVVFNPFQIAKVYIYVSYMYFSSYFSVIYMFYYSGLIF